MGAAGCTAHACMSPTASPVVFRVPETTVVKLRSGAGRSLRSGCCCVWMGLPPALLSASLLACTPLQGSVQTIPFTGDVLMTYTMD